MILILGKGEQRVHIETGEGKSQLWVNVYQQYLRDGWIDLTIRVDTE